jgi:hypothetical protein
MRAAARVHHGHACRALTHTRAQVFDALSRESLHRIAGTMLAEVAARAEGAGVALEVAAGVEEAVVAAATADAADANGARGLRRTLTALLEDPLSELLLDAGVLERRVGGESDQEEELLHVRAVAERGEIRVVASSSAPVGPEDTEQGVPLLDIPWLGRDRLQNARRALTRAGV